MQCDFGSTLKRRGEAVVMWAKRNQFLRQAGKDGMYPASNLNLTGFLGGVLCIPDNRYGEFLEEYSKDIRLGAPQFLTECRGETFRFYVDLDIVRPTAMGKEDFDRIALACHNSIEKFFRKRDTGRGKKKAKTGDTPGVSNSNELGLPVESAVITETADAADASDTSGAVASAKDATPGGDAVEKSEKPEKPEKPADEYTTTVETFRSILCIADASESE